MSNCFKSGNEVVCLEGGTKLKEYPWQNDG
jgi:hypothetical protein